MSAQSKPKKIEFPPPKVESTPTPADFLNSLDPIRITLTFSERQRNEWEESVSQILLDAVQISSDDLRSVTLRVTSYFDRVTNDYVTEYDFLDLTENPLVSARKSGQLARFQRLVPTFFLSALRDAAQEFKPRSQFWRPFVRALNLDDENRAELEAALNELNREVLKQHTSFETVKESLKKTAQLLPHERSDPISIDAIPSKLFDILSRTQVNLSSRTGAHIPLARHGSGTQSVAVICLFEAFLQSQLANDHGEHAFPLLALEEPEAHLHPSAINAVGKMLQSLSGQKIISTHSGDLLSSVPIHCLRRLRRSEGKISIHRVEGDLLNQDELAKLNYQVRATRGSLLFSRCWMLVEGETEAILMNECARALDIDLLSLGISCVEYTQVGLEKLIKLADQFGIEWYVMADGDDAGERYVRIAEAQLHERKSTDHIKSLNDGAIEVLLCMEGYGDIYLQTVSRQKKDQISAPTGTVEYWRQVVGAQQGGQKIRNAMAVAERIAENAPESVPNSLKEAIEQVSILAKQAE